MLYDFRTYELKPGALPAYQAAVREVALPVRRRYGIALAGWYYPEVGTLNRVVHIWAFRDWAHLAEAKRAFRQDPQWVNDYLPRVLPLIVRQHAQVMRAPDFAPQPTLPPPEAGATL